MFNKKRSLTAAVLLSCSFFMAPYYAHAAEEEEPNCEHPSSYISVEAGNLTYNFDIYSASTHPGEHWRGEYTTDDNGQKIKEYATYRDLFTDEEQVFGKSIAYMHNLINPSGTTNPTIKLELLPDKDANAAAQSDTYIIRDATGKPSIQISDTELAAVLQGKYQPEDNDIVAEIEVDLAPPDANWYIEKFPSLPSNGTDSDYYGTITHEMFHALGLGTYISADTSGSVTFGTSCDYDDGFRSMDVFNKYEMGIRDVFGRVVYYAVSSGSVLESKTYTYFDDNPIDPNASDSMPHIDGELVSRDIVSISLDKYNVLKESEAFDPDKFYILKGNDVGTNSGTYFTGKNVETVLNGALIAWPDGSEVQPVPGLPLNGYEGGETTPELSHIELQNANMSHQNYRNWCNFTEAELAILQDLGYNVDRGAYYGKSIYNSGEKDEDDNITYYKFTNTNSFNSTQMHGIGLHVYGSYVDVEQNAALNADGAYGTGIRVDGVGNKVTIASDISANNIGGNGLLVAYGKNHEITLNANKTIEATGADGVAARFDFGSNELGDQAGYRGSYINVKYNYSNADADEEDEDEVSGEGKLLLAQSEAQEETQGSWVQEDLPDAIDGALVENFNVAGKLIGNKAAIYISPNAYVKNINILDGAEITGDIISEWNPNEIIYQNGNINDLDDEQILKPALPYDENSLREEGLTYLNFGCKNGEDDNLIADSKFDMTLKNNISGSNGFAIDLWAGKLNTSGTNNVNIVHVAEDYDDGTSGPIATKYTNTGDLTINSSLVVEGTFVNEGKLQTSFDEDGESLKISGTGSANLTGTEDSGTFVLNAEQGFYKGTTYIDLANTAPNTPEISIVNENIIVNSNSASLKMSAEFDGENIITITTLRDYTSLASTSGESQLAEQIALKANEIANNPDYTGDPENLSPLDQKWQNIIAGMDYNDSTGATAKQAMKALTPHVYNSSAQATLNTHTMLNNLNMLGNFSNNVPAARTGGGRGPAADASAKHNSWRNIVVPFYSYTDQHNGTSSYTNHNSGVLGAMERTLDNGLTHGYHAAVNHQSTSSASQRIKGEGFYLGTHASYAPADWKGWQIFGSARLGLENMRSHRNLAIGGGSMGTSDADWTGFSGSFTVGTALEKAHGVVKSGPFAALGYSFAHRPSVHEDGGGIRTELASATYDSLQTQLGYRLTTTPKALDSYESTKWQAHASVAWNHELLSDNGSTDFALEGLSKAINDKTADYGRDSMSVAAGITFKTPKCLDVGLTLGSDIYRKSGSSVYGKVNFEWKF